MLRENLFSFASNAGKAPRGSGFLPVEIGLKSHLSIWRNRTFSVSMAESFFNQYQRKFRIEMKC